MILPMRSIARPRSGWSSYDNALAETINGLYKAEIIHSARTVAVVRSRRVRDAGMGVLVQQPAAPEPIGNIPPVEAEQRYYAANERSAMAA